MKVLLRVSAVIAAVLLSGFAIRQSLHATPAPDASVTPCQVAGCACGCREGGPCNCAERAQNQEVLDALASISARLDALESPQAVVVPPEPEAIAVAPARTADDIMEGLQEAFDDVVDPVDVPMTHDGNGYLTSSAIAAWLSQHSGGRGWSYGGGDSGAPLRNHLIRSHGWRESQLLGLNDSQMRELHSASHNGRLRPRSDVDNLNIMMTSASDEGVPVYFDTRDDYWHWVADGVNYRWHTLEEGRTYGGRWVFQGGRMCDNGRECSTVTQPARTYSPPVVRIGSSSSGCPSGNCPRPQMFRGRRGRW